MQSTTLQGSGIPPAGLRLCLSDDLGAFTACWPSSDRLGPARAYPFQCADFLEAWVRTIGPARQVRSCFVAVLDHLERPLALLPLGIERTRFDIRTLRFLDGGVSDYNAPVLFPSAADWSPATVETIWAGVQSLLGDVDLVVLEKMPGVVEDLRNPFISPAAAPYPESGHYTALSQPWEEYEEHRLPHGPNTRRNLRRLSDLGTVRFEVAQTEAARERFLEAMIRQKSRRYAETGRGADGFDRPGYRRFFHEATARLAQSGTLHLSALWLDDTILATHWGYLVRNRLYHIMPTFERDRWHRYAPGRLLLYYLLEWAVRNGATIFDMGIGDEEYKSPYCDARVDLYREERAVSPRGRAFLLVRRGKREFQGTRIVQRVRSALRALRRTSSSP